MTPTTATEQQAMEEYDRKRIVLVQTNRGATIKYPWTAARNKSFKEHKVYAKPMLAILDGIAEVLKDLPHTSKQCRPLRRKVFRIAFAAKDLQRALEASLAKVDRSDLRSWALYYPDNRPNVTIHYEK
jgi:hypothetical protein